MDNDQLRNMLCSAFCPYYKPGKNEELACQGYHAVSWFADSGRDIVSSGETVPAGQAEVTLLSECLCPLCPFFSSDCDFAAGVPAPACGGFVLLSRLMGEGVLSGDDIRNYELYCNMQQHGSGLRINATNPNQGGNMEKYSLREVVEQAVRTEKLGYEFYTSMMQKFSEDKGLQELFGRLAEKEREHERTFLELGSSITEDEPTGWEEVSEYLRAIVESEFFLGKNKSLPSLEQVKTVKDAVNFATGFEKETLLYFHAVREALDKKEIVDRIIDEERSHIIWLSRFESGLAPA